MHKEEIEREGKTVNAKLKEIVLEEIKKKFWGILEEKE